MLAVVYKIPGAGSRRGWNLRGAGILFHRKVHSRNPFAVDWLPSLGGLRSALLPPNTPNHGATRKILSPIGRIDFTAHWIMDADQGDRPRVGDY